MRCHTRHYPNLDCAGPVRKPFPGDSNDHIRDTTPPILTVPPDQILECPSDASTNVTGIATGQDACGQVTIRYSDSVSNICGNAKLIRRTWIATDECGNVTSKLQTITVQDKTAPSLIIPADRTGMPDR